MFDEHGIDATYETIEALWRMADACQGDHVAGTGRSGSLAA